MAVFRKVHTQIWSDPFFSDLDSEKKMFYLYILTNERTKQCGIYEISKKHICFDLGLSLDKVNKLLLFFIKIGKLQFSDATNEVAIKNWAKYNYSTSPKVVRCIESELKAVKNKSLIEYIYSMDTLSQEEKEKEEEQEGETVKSKGFIVPTLDEVQSYCLERNNNVDANMFVDFYSSKGWYVGKNKMKDWKACVRTWEKNKTETTINNKQDSLVERARKLQQEYGIK
jgi:hypothetical protein